jgi:hypothetical protein
MRSAPRVERRRRLLFAFLCSQSPTLQRAAVTDTLFLSFTCLPHGGLLKKEKNSDIPDASEIFPCTYQSQMLLLHFLTHALLPELALAS